MNIRFANSEDIHKISLHGPAFIDRSISGRYLTCNPIGFEDILNFAIKTGTVVVWVAYEKDKMVGAISLLTAPNLYNPSELMGDIWFIDVLPEYRKRGLGKRLIQTVEQYAKSANILSLTISFKQKEIADRICEGTGYELFEYKVIKRIKEN